MDQKHLNKKEKIANNSAQLLKIADNSLLGWALCLISVYDVEFGSFISHFLHILVLGLRLMC